MNWSIRGFVFWCHEEVTGPIFNPSIKDHVFFTFQFFYHQNGAVIDGAFADTYKKECRSRNRQSIGSPVFSLQNCLGEKIGNVEIVKIRFLRKNAKMVLKFDSKCAIWEPPLGTYLYYLFNNHIYLRCIHYVPIKKSLKCVFYQK